MMRSSMEILMQRLCGFLVCRFLIACAAVAVGATASAGAAPVHGMPAVAGAERLADNAYGMAHAFRYEDGTIKGLDGWTVLDDLVDPVPERDIADAAVLADLSRIAAGACRGGPCAVARRDAMTAVAEPSALVLLGAGVALLGWRRRQAWSFTPLAPRCPG
jgi:PEP-CTERM motif